MHWRGYSQSQGPAITHGLCSHVTACSNIQINIRNITSHRSDRYLEGNISGKYISAYVIIPSWQELTLSWCFNTEISRGAVASGSKYYDRYKNISPLKIFCSRNDENVSERISEAWEVFSGGCTLSQVVSTFKLQTWNFDRKYGVEEKWESLEDKQEVKKS